MRATNATEQHQAMLTMLAKGMALPMISRISLAADLAAAQIELNAMLLLELAELRAEIETLKRGPDG